MIDAPHIRRAAIDRDRKRLIANGLRLVKAAQGLTHAREFASGSIGDIRAAGVALGVTEQCEALISKEIARLTKDDGSLPLLDAVQAIIVNLQKDFAQANEAEENEIRKAITGELSTSLYRNS